MTEALENDYRGLEVSALAKEGMAYEARKKGEASIGEAEGYEAQALELRAEMGRIAEQLTQTDQLQEN